MLSDDKIIEMAKRSPVTETYWLHPDIPNYAEEIAELIAFARLIESQVREEVAKTFDGNLDYKGFVIAAAIRGSGK